jgi:hypothetical protein
MSKKEKPTCSLVWCSRKRFPAWNICSQSGQRHVSLCSWNSSSCDFQYGFDFRALSQNVHAKFFGAGVDAVEMVERRDEVVDNREDAAL